MRRCAPDKYSEQMNLQKRPEFSGHRRQFRSDLVSPRNRRASPREHAAFGAQKR
jgi:hypothetical protein